MAASDVFLYRYDASPFSVKIDNVLLLKNIAHLRVNVSAALPRPEITNLLGLNYRRIPVLTIGNDIYCDTSLIASVLERRFPASKGYGSIFPPKKHGGSADTGLLTAFSRHYVDSVLFPLVPPMLPWEKFPPSFIKDRSLYFGNTINPEAMAASRNKSMSLLSAHLALIEAQLGDGREWLFDTEAASLADVSVHFVYAWAKSLRGTETLFDVSKFPNSLQWLERMAKHLATLRKQYGTPAKVTGEEAAKAIAASSFESYEVVGFDTVEADRLGLRLGDSVSIAPGDTGRAYPTVGKLVALDTEEFAIEIQGAHGILRCHFPRIGYIVKKSSSLKNKL